MKKKPFVLPEEVKNDPVWKRQVEWAEMLYNAQEKKGIPYSRATDEELYQCYLLAKKTEKELEERKNSNK